MGHRVNPNSFRLNLNRPWFFQWVSYTNENYKYLILNDYFILKLLNNLFFSLYNEKNKLESNYLFYNLKLLRFSNKSNKIILNYKKRLNNDENFLEYNCKKLIIFFFIKLRILFLNFYKKKIINLIKKKIIKKVKLPELKKKWIKINKMYIFFFYNIKVFFLILKYIFNIIKYYKKIKYYKLIYINNLNNIISNLTKNFNSKFFIYFINSKNFSSKKLTIENKKYYVINDYLNLNNLKNLKFKKLYLLNKKIKILIIKKNLYLNYNLYILIFLFNKYNFLNFKFFYLNNYLNYINNYLNKLYNMNNIYLKKIKKKNYNLKNINKNFKYNLININYNFYKKNNKNILNKKKLNIIYNYIGYKFEKQNNFIEEETNKYYKFYNYSYNNSLYFLNLKKKKLIYKNKIINYNHNYNFIFIYTLFFLKKNKVFNKNLLNIYFNLNLLKKIYKNNINIILFNKNKKILNLFNKFKNYNIIKYLILKKRIKKKKRKKVKSKVPKKLIYKYINTFFYLNFLKLNRNKKKICLYKYNLKKKFTIKKKNEKIINFKKFIFKIYYFNFFKFNLIDASFITYFIKYKCHYRINIVKLLKISINYLMRKKGIFPGFKIQLLGRFSRKTRSTKLIYTRGKMGYNQLEMPIDYNEESFITRFGISGIKVWFLNSINVNKLMMKKKLLKIYMKINIYE